MGKPNSLDDLQNVQAKFDQEYLTYPNHYRPDDKIRHINLHLGKLVGKVSTYSEAVEHGRAADDSVLKTEVMPDLLFYALQLANIYDVDLEKVYLQRLEDDKRRIGNERRQD